MDPVSAYAHFTQDIVDLTGMSRPMLHMHAGMAIYLVSQVMLGTRRGSILAISMVLFVELLNELMNFLYKGGVDWSDTTQDIWLTLFWPTMIYAASKYRRWQWQQAEDRRLRQEALATV